MDIGSLLALLGGLHQRNMLSRDRTRGLLAHPSLGGQLGQMGSPGIMGAITSLLSSLGQGGLSGSAMGSPAGGAAQMATQTGPAPSNFAGLLSSLSPALSGYGQGNFQTVPTPSPLSALSMLGGPATRAYPVSSGVAR